MKGALRFLLGSVALIAAMPLNAASAGSSASSGQWWGYHGGGAGSGATFAVGGFRTSSARWTSPQLDGQIYGEPLVERGEIIVATQNDSVYALSAERGTILWWHHLATPVPATMLPLSDDVPNTAE